MVWARSLEQSKNAVAYTVDIGALDWKVLGLAG